eukprot:1158302-Pelagomonas_calceolata.AAC.2
MNDPRHRWTLLERRAQASPQADTDQAGDLSGRVHNPYYRWTLIKRRNSPTECTILMTGGPRSSRGLGADSAADATHRHQRSIWQCPGLHTADQVAGGCEAALRLLCINDAIVGVNVYGWHPWRVMTLETCKVAQRRLNDSLWMTLATAIAGLRGMHAGLFALCCVVHRSSRIFDAPVI